jgi:hypothetical protein
VNLYVSTRHIIWTAQRVRYELDDRGIGVRFLAGIPDVYLLHNVQTDFGAHPASYTVGTGALPPEVERMMSETDHSLPSSADIKNAWSYASTPLSLYGVVFN